MEADQNGLKQIAPHFRVLTCIRQNSSWTGILFMMPNSAGGTLLYFPSFFFFKYDTPVRIAKITNSPPVHPIVKVIKELVL